MVFPVLTIVVLFIIAMSLANKKSDRQMKEPLQRFWEKEQAANLVRKQSLDDLDYIRIPEDFYSFSYDPEADPHLIGRGVLKLTKATNGYVHFEIPIEYRRDATPTYVGISILSSMLGEYFTGSSNTVLYIDELQFNY